MKKSRLLISVITVVLIVLNVTHIEVPFKRLFLYTFLAFIIFFDFLLPFLKKKWNNK